MAKHTQTIRQQFIGNKFLNDDLEFEVINDNRFKEFSFDLYVRGFHVYKDIWNPRIGQGYLKC